MATKKTKKTQKLDEQPGQSDPQAPLDAGLLLRAAQPLLKALAEDLLERARQSEAIAATLRERHAAEQSQERTADPYEVWLRFFTKQVAAAWFLSCVFVRVLEDRGLVQQARIAGPGALDSQQLFFELAPSLSERDYLLTVFRELSTLPGARELFDTKHNPVWLLAPSAERASALLQLFRMPSADAPALRFGQADTRFLGDLYQDLDEDVRERFALLQTPHFIESFILDRTLERAIERFGLDDTTLIDPTCGSGHFLLGAFERLFEHRLRAEPGLDVRAAAHKALDAVYGSDINPYAIAIARFRLTLAYLEKAGFRRLEDAPKLPLHLAVADSLLHNPQRKLAYQRATEHQQQVSFGEHRLEERTAWERSSLYELEDPEAVRDVLYREHAAVVGNPPYVTVKDKALREKYRGTYPLSAAGKYSLAAPFTERLFQLARERAHVGMITANSFMKREFGKSLIEKFLPSVNLDIVVNTSGAYIPGHGTPTVLLFGSAEPSVNDEALTVLAKRGEPSTPEDASKGEVWSSITAHWREVGFDNDYISVASTPLAMLAKHPWSLGGGGATELKQMLEERAHARLGQAVDEIGFASFTGLDDAFILPENVVSTLGLESSVVRPMVTGEDVRDWSITTQLVSVAAYDKDTQRALPLNPSARWGRFLWPYRTAAENVSSFGGRTRAQEGQNWWEWYRWQPERYRAPFRIAFAFVATHNHFVLDRGGKVFKQSAPIIKLPESATEDDHLALLAYLNSSTACFWMKQVCHNKSNASQKHTTDPARAAYEFAGTALEGLPLPDLGSMSLTFAARLLLELGETRARWLGGSIFKHSAPRVLSDVGAWKSFIADGWMRFDEATRRANYVQEEIDWQVYAAFGLVDPAPVEPRRLERGSAALGARPFEVDAGYDAGVSDRAKRTEAFQGTVSVPDEWKGRTPLLQREGIRLLESREYKRMWRETEQNVDQQVFRESLPRTWLFDWLLACAEKTFAGQVLTRRVLAEALTTQGLLCAAEWLGNDERAVADEVVRESAVPFIAAWRYTDSGLEKRAAWENTWELQRREDCGENNGSIPVPPKYEQGDFRDGIFWRLRVVSHAIPPLAHHTLS